MTTTPTSLPDLGIREHRRDHPRRAFVEQVMGLPVSVHVRGPRARERSTTAAVADFFMSLRLDDALFSTWRPESPVSRIRRGELDLADAGPRILQVATLCREAEARTEGWFSAWLPDLDGAIRFNPTGLVKGWAVEDALAPLAGRLGAHDVLVSAGGDVVVACSRTDTPDWRIGIEDPQDRSRTITTLGLRRGAVATSGTAARGQHILNPGTGAPATGLLSATVIGPSLTWADVHATAAFAQGPGAANRLQALADHTALLVDVHGVRASASRTAEDAKSRACVRPAITATIE